VISQLESNIWKLTVLLVTNKRLFVSILGVYILTIPGATAKTIGLVWMAGNLLGFFIEVPSGYFADKVGHRKALIIAKLSMLVSTLFYLLSTNVPFLIAGSMFMATGWALLSGTTTAFMHETLRALGRDGEYSKVMGKARALGFGL